MIEFAAPSAHLRPLDVNSVYGLMNIGATAVVSAESKGVVDAMACAWNCALDLNPTKVTVVLSKSHFTRRLLEESGLFALSLGAVGNVAALQQLGSVSMNRDAEKLEKCPGRFFRMPGWEMPLLEGGPHISSAAVSPSLMSKEPTISSSARRLRPGGTIASSRPRATGSSRRLRRSSARSTPPRTGASTPQAR